MSMHAPQSSVVRNRGEAGFTLIELLTVISIIGVLAALSLQGFTLYKPYAAYAVAQSGADTAMKSVYAAYAQPGVDAATFPALDDEQLVPGPLTDVTARELFPGFQLGRRQKISYFHDPTCRDEFCGVQTSFDVRHMDGRHFVRWTRTGDGIEVSLKVAGDGLGP